MVWLYIIGWSTYGPEAPATFAPEFIDTKNDTRKAIMPTSLCFLTVVWRMAISIAPSEMPFQQPDEPIRK